MIGQTALQPQRSIFIHVCLSRSLLQTQMHLDYVTDGSNDTGDSNEVPRYIVSARYMKLLRRPLADGRMLAG